MTKQPVMILINQLKQLNHKLVLSSITLKKVPSPSIYIKCLFNLHIIFVVDSALIILIDFFSPFVSLIGKNMAVLPRTLMSFVIMTMLIELAMAATYTVGGPNGGWDATTDLQTWVSSQTFLVGDNLSKLFSTL